MTRPAYHSALRPPAGYPPRDYWEGHGSVAMLTNLPRIPVEFYDCDVLYMDPPWDAGYAEFNRRAGIDSPPPYDQWIRALAGSIRSMGRPAVVVIGKRGAARMAPDWTAPVTLNGAPAVAAGFGLPRDAIEGCATAEAVLRRLAEQYTRVGDPCAGYGRAGRIFAEAGKTFVMGDSNPECIGYIAAHAEGWFQ